MHKMKVKSTFATYFCCANTTPCRRQFHMRWNVSRYCQRHYW